MYAKEKQDGKAKVVKELPSLLPILPTAAEVLQRAALPTTVAKRSMVITSRLGNNLALPKFGEGTLAETLTVVNTRFFCANTARHKLFPRGNKTQ